MFLHVVSGWITGWMDDMQPVWLAGCLLPADPTRQVEKTKSSSAALLCTPEPHLSNRDHVVCRCLHSDARVFHKKKGKKKTDNIKPNFDVYSTDIMQGKSPNKKASVFSGQNTTTCVRSLGNRKSTQVQEVQLPPDFSAKTTQGVSLTPNYLQTDWVADWLASWQADKQAERFEGSGGAQTDFLAGCWQSRATEWLTTDSLVG